VTERGGLSVRISENELGIESVYMNGKQNLRVGMTLNRKTGGDGRHP
jgi:hypothetical protein